MNKVILMGRLTKDPEVRYTQSSEPLAVTRYTLAVNKRFKREGEPDADFINCVAFRRPAEFAEKYFKKGQQVLVEGSISVRSWDDQSGQKRWTTEVIIENQYFAESKNSGGSDGGYSKPYNSAPQTPAPSNTGFFAVEESVDDDDLPF